MRRGCGGGESWGESCSRPCLPPPCLPQFPRLVLGPGRRPGLVGAGVIPAPAAAGPESGRWGPRGALPRGEGELDALLSRLRNKCFYFYRDVCRGGGRREKGVQGGWGEGAKEPDSDSEMDTERGGLAPPHSATWTRTGARSPAATRAAGRGQPEPAPGGRDGLSSDPPRPAGRWGWTGRSEASPGRSIPLTAGGRGPGCGRGLGRLWAAKMPPHVAATCTHH